MMNIKKKARSKKLKCLHYNFNSVYLDVKWQSVRMPMFLPHETNENEFEYCMVPVTLHKFPERHRYLFDAAINSIKYYCYNYPSYFFNQFRRVKWHKPVKSLDDPDMKLAPYFWYLFTVLVASETLFPLSLEFKYVHQKNAIFFCILDEHYLNPGGCNCMEKAGVDFFYDWDVRNRHFEIFPERNDKRKKYRRNHIFFIWRTPFPGAEEITMELQFSPVQYTNRTFELFFYHGAPMYPKAFETRSYHFKIPTIGFVLEDGQKYKSTNISSIRARGDFIH